MNTKVCIIIVGKGESDLSLSLLLETEKFVFSGRTRRDREITSWISLTSTDIWTAAWLFFSFSKTRQLPTTTTTTTTQRNGENEGKHRWVHRSIGKKVLPGVWFWWRQCCCCSCCAVCLRHPAQLSGRASLSSTVSYTEPLNPTKKKAQVTHTHTQTHSWPTYDGKARPHWRNLFSPSPVLTLITWASLWLWLDCFPGLPFFCFLSRKDQVCSAAPARYTHPPSCL
jgi:hypothetical protein